MYNINYFSEVTQTAERKAMAELTGLNKIRIGDDPRKCTFRLILPSINIAKIIYKLANEICGHYAKKRSANIKEFKVRKKISRDSGKIGEVKDGRENTLKSKVIIKSNTVEIYIWNAWDTELEKKITDEYNNYSYQELRSTIYYKMLKAKEFYQSQLKRFSPSNPIVLDTSKDYSSEELDTSNKKFNSKKCNEFWNTVFNFVAVGVGYARGQWLVGELNGYTYEPRDGFEKGDQVAGFKVNTKLGKVVGDRGRYFHFSGPYARGIQAVVEFIEKKYKVKIKDVTWVEPGYSY